MKQFLFLLMVNFLLVESRMFSDAVDDELSNLGEGMNEVSFIIYVKQTSFSFAQDGVKEFNVRIYEVWYLKVLKATLHKRDSL